MYKLVSGLWVETKKEEEEGKEIKKSGIYVYPNDSGIVIDDMKKICHICEDYIDRRKGFCQAEQGKYLCAKCRNKFFKCITGPDKEKCKVCSFAVYLES